MKMSSSAFVPSDAVPVGGERGSVGGGAECGDAGAPLLRLLPAPTPTPLPRTRLQRRLPLAHIHVDGNPFILAFLPVCWLVSLAVVDIFCRLETHHSHRVDVSMSRDTVTSDSKWRKFDTNGLGFLVRTQHLDVSKPTHSKLLCFPASICSVVMAAALTATDS